MSVFLNWALSSPTGPHDVAFAHIQGPAAFGKSLVIPNRLWHFTMLGGRTNISVVHVVPRSNLSILSARRAQGVSGAAARGCTPLTTLDYQQFLRLLKQSRQNGSWRVDPRGPLAPKIVFIIDVDKDFSAPFFLALYAAIEFSLSITEEQPQATIRMATMSSDPISYLYYHLLSLNDLDVTRFVSTPPELEPWHNVPVGSGKEDPFKAIMSIQEHLDPDFQQTTVYFKDTPVLPPRWKEDEWEARGWSCEQFQLDCHGNFRVDSEPQTGHTMFNVPCGTRGYGKLQVSGYLHIILSNTRLRPIFDMETRQVVHVDLHVSSSDICQQISWVDRTTCPRSRVYVYFDKEYIENRMNHGRRNNIHNHQLAGFIAGLAQFEGWPSRMRSLSRLVTLLAYEDEPTKGIIDQTVQRLELQGMLRIEESVTSPVISLHNSIPDTFFTLLSLVDYDARLAYLLVQPSDPMTTCLKIQVAAMLTIGQNKLISFQRGISAPEDRSYVEIAMKTGYGADLAHVGTLWMILGLLKKGKFEAVYKDESRPFVDEKVLVGYGQEWEKRCTAIHNILLPRQPRVDILDEIGTLSKDQVEVLHWDCLRAFTFQIGIVNYHDDGRFPTVHDFVSGVELEFECAAIMIDFDTIRENDPECTVGFYTTLFRTKDHPKTLINDWNWIPSSVWRRWREHLEADGSDRWASLTNKYELGRNIDEFKSE